MKVFFLALIPFSAVICFGQIGPKARIAHDINDARIATLKGNLHPLARPESETGRMDGSAVIQSISLHFNLTAAQQSDLDALLTAQQKPSSPSFHQWLTPAAYADRFGMPQTDLDKVTAWLQAHGMTVDAVAQSRNSVRFSGRAVQVEQAFHTELHHYTVDGETHFANSSEPSLPEAFAASVAAIHGLNDFKLKPKTKVIRKPAYTLQTTTGPGYFMLPQDFATIYNVQSLYNAGFDGTGQTIGVMGQTDIVLSDIATFRSLSGLSANVPQIVLIPGSKDPGVLSDIAEADLDIEGAGSVARNATIVYVNSTDVFDSLAYAIQNQVNGITIPILSVSYGDCEPDMATSDVTYIEQLGRQANAQGQTLVGAGGDSGATDCDTGTVATKGLQVDYPASSAYWTGVGGTEFYGDANNPSQYWSSVNGPMNGSALMYIPEMAWNDSPTRSAAQQQGSLDAGGGGASILFGKPSWQTGVAGIPDDGARDVPDISLASSNNVDVWVFCTEEQSGSGRRAAFNKPSCVNGFADAQQSISGFGGTSVAVPTFAGMLALAEQMTGSALGNVNPLLYQLASQPQIYSSAFHDIVQGSNAQPCRTGSLNCPSGGTIGYSAGAGYDQATGLGSVDAFNLATAIAAAVTGSH